jgi:hypothetical protein
MRVVVAASEKMCSDLSGEKNRREKEADLSSHVAVAIAGVRRCSNLVAVQC